jgi:uncharacterized membrane protein YedE/YeeE
MESPTHVSVAGDGATCRCRWRPYVAGIGIGVLSWLAFAVVNQPIGISTAVSEVSGAVAMPVAGREAVLSNPYWAKTVPRWDYGTLFLVGTFVGALAAALFGRTFRVETVPQVWRERFGPSATKRFLAAFVGGVLVMFGARLAGGCTSGHGISGSLQLALSSWTFFLVMFASGLVTAWLMFGLSPRVARGGARAA